VIEERNDEIRNQNDEKQETVTGVSFDIRILFGFLVSDFVIFKASQQEQCPFGYTATGIGYRFNPVHWQKMRQRKRGLFTR
jgi:hypothetical protein